MVAAKTLALGLAAAASTNALSLGLCMTSSQAQQVATNFGTLISSYTKTLADQVLASNFVDTSESVNTLINTCPEPGSSEVSLTGPTFSSKAAFEAGQGSQPAINFKQLNIWPNCNSVTFRWETTNTANISDVKPVIGMITAETTLAPLGSKYPWLISAIYSEFDSGAWLQNLEEAGLCSGSNSNSKPVMS